MSELHIGLVAEGPTDQIVIESALRAILGRPIVVTLLQPEATRPKRGEGWCGVLKWCLEQRGLGFERLEDDPTLGLYDLIVLHLDADVADKAYVDCGFCMTDPAVDLSALPCAAPCPPAVATVDQLQAVLLGWLGLAAPGPRTMLCLPSKAIESWVAAAWLPADHALLAGDLECVAALADRLKGLPLAMRIRKTRREYAAASLAIRQHWSTVCDRCEQAERFQQAVAEMRF